MILNKADNSKKRKPRPKDCHIAFKVSEDIYQLLTMKSLENKYGKNPSRYVRHVIEEHIRITNPKLVKTSNNNLFVKINQFFYHIKMLHKLMEKMVYLHFSAHKEIPDDQKEAVSISTERRAKEFFSFVYGGGLAAGETDFEEYLSDAVEEGE